MNTSPAFQFYPADFLNGTLLMDAAEVGAYMRLLCYQWQQGAVPDDADDLSKIATLPHAKLIRRVLPKFHRTSEGLQNMRLLNEQQAIVDYRITQSQNGKKGGRPKKPNQSENNPPLSIGLNENNPSQRETEADEKRNQSSHTHTHTHTQSHSTPIAPKGADLPESLSLVSPETEPVETIPAPDAWQKKKGGRVPELEFPAAWSSARCDTMRRWLSYKRELGKGYKPTGFAGLVGKVAGLDDEALMACVEESIANGWQGLFPDKLVFQEPAMTRQKKGGWPPDTMPFLAAEASVAEPDGWQAAWGELYPFAAPETWFDVPDANRADVLAWLRTEGGAV